MINVEFKVNLQFEKHQVSVWQSNQDTMILHSKNTTSAPSHKLMISKHMQLERRFIFERLVANKAQIGSFLIMCTFCMLN